ncbi:MAG: prolipoprotein diacylglyceryl transferase [Planctomycetota bacterium]
MILRRIPVRTINLNPFSLDFSNLHAAWLHPVFEALAYFAAGLWYRLSKRKRKDPLRDQDRTTVIVAAILGAAIASKLLHHLASPAEFQMQLQEVGWRGIFPYLMSGKTIVGALLGGWLAVEVTKKHYGIQQRSGDLFALPLCLGIAVGRLGCFFAGPADDTLGTATDSIFGIDFGDGILRHPTPLYEIVFLFGLGMIIAKASKLLRQGEAFRVFLLGYLSFRFLIDFLKPYEVYFGLRIIQWACLLGIMALLRGFLTQPKLSS